jgi:hypothetical protein
MAAHVMTFMGMAPFGSIIADSVAERLGTPHTLALGGHACMVGALLFILRLPNLQPSSPNKNATDSTDSTE